MSLAESQEAEQPALLWRTLAGLDSAGLAYCLLRDSDQLETLAAVGGELDLLVARADRERMRVLLATLGFAEAPTPGHGRHRFFVAYDAARDTWLELDVVDRLEFGPARALRAQGLAESCLRRRVRNGRAFSPAPEEELVALLLHCALDKRRFEPRRAARLIALCEAVSDVARLELLLARYWSEGSSWKALSAQIRGGDAARLLAEAPRVAARLRAHDRLAPLRALGRRLARRIGRAGRFLRPRALSVALLAPDGAGKSTLVAELRDSFYLPMRPVYMGLYGQSQRANRGFAARLFAQWGRYLRARLHLARGEFVVFDRYGYDALLDPGRPLSRAGRLRRGLLARACPAPDLVVILDVPGELLHARKAERDAAALERQRQSYLRLAARLPHCHVLDGTRAVDAVRRELVSLIWNDYARRNAFASASGAYRNAFAGGSALRRAS